MLHDLAVSGIVIPTITHVRFMSSNLCWQSCDVMYVHVHGWIKTLAWSHAAAATHIDADASELHHIGPTSKRPQGPRTAAT